MSSNYQENSIKLNCKNPGYMFALKKNGFFCRRALLCLFASFYKALRVILESFLILVSYIVGHSIPVAFSLCGSLLIVCLI